MALHAFYAGCNIVGIFKNGTSYGMCCAWAQMIDYDRITMLLGAQSVTGKVLEKGDIVGVSALAKRQKEIALIMGDAHSDQLNKWSGISYRTDETALLVNGSRVQMKCQVLAVYHLEGIEADAFVDLKVLDYIQDEDQEFLSAYDV